MAAPLVLSARAPHPHQVLCLVLSLALAEGQVQLGKSTAVQSVETPSYGSLRLAQPEMGLSSDFRAVLGPGRSQI